MKIFQTPGFSLIDKKKPQFLRIMKFTCFILMVTLINVNATVYSQTTKLSAQMTNVSIKEVFKTIEEQSEFRFFYSDNLNFINNKIDINARNKTVETILDEVLENSNLTYKVLENHLIIIVPADLLQQGPTVSGKVTDDHGDPMPGVNVIIKGTTNGVVTDYDGKFSLTVPDVNATLIFSFVGYTGQEVVVGNQRTISVTLKEDTKELEEVVVVGYSSMKKENLTGAVTQIKGEMLENRPVVNISQALQGTVANLNISSTDGGAPGSKQNINIRGYTGFGLDDDGKMVSKSQSPLIVIDGVQGGDINSINMDDVESISVLKDAASVAIYGSSAPYGVIIINTKKGRKGKRPTITYNNNFGWAQPINLPEMMNSLDFANIYNEASVNAGRSPIFTDNTIERIKDYQAGKIPYETIANPTAGADSWYSWGSGNANNDWFDIYFKKASFSQQHNVGVSGGSENSSYYIGLGYNQKDGMYNYGNDQYQRYNARANLSTDLTKWLTFGFRGAFSRGATDTPNTYAGKTGGNYMHQIARKWPTVPLHNPNGLYSETSDVLLQEEGGRNKTTTDWAMLTGEFVIKPMEGWDITANYTFDGTYIDKAEHMATIYQVLPSGNTAAIGGTTPNSFKRINNKDQHNVINLFSSYENKWAGHYFKVLLGYTQELYEYQEFTSSNNYLYSDDLPSLSTTYGTSSSVSDKVNELAIRGAFGRINYNYQEKYLVEFNGRYDGTSRFLSDVRFKFYPGISAAWVPSKETFWEPIQQYVNSFKFRASYGKLGDQGFVDNYYPFYPSLTTKKPTDSNWMYSDGRQAYVSNPPLVNSNLTWVTTSTIDFGADMSFLTNRLNVSFDWYQRKADDFVGPAEVLPAFLGTSTPLANNSTMVTKGIELTIGWRDHIGDFNYSVNAVLSDYKSEVTKYPNPTGLNTTWYKGRMVGDIWGYETYGLYQTDDEVNQAPSQAKISGLKWQKGDVRYANLDGDNEISEGDNTLDNPGDRKVIGNNTPRFSYGLTLTADYKGFDFSIFFQGVAKRDAWVGSNYFWGINGDEWQSSLFTEHHDRWRTDNPGGYFPRYYMSSQNGKNTKQQSRYLQNAAYMRIKNLQLGYTLPLSLVEKINFQRLRVFVSVENLATFTNMLKTMDPEFSASDGKLYPLQRTWAFGLNVTF